MRVSKAARRRCIAVSRSSRGFTNPFRVEYYAVNLDSLQGMIDGGIAEITPDALYEAGLIHAKVLVKVLGRGELTGKATVKAHAFSKTASAAIEAAGGTVEILPLPFAVRPPASGNQFVNR